MSQNAPQHALIVRDTDSRKPLREGQHRRLAATSVRITSVQQTTARKAERGRSGKMAA